MELEPESEALMAHYRDRLCFRNQISDRLSIPKFGEQTRKDLLKILGKNDSVDLVESIVRLGNYSDSKELDERRKAVSKLLKKEGISLPRGKRTKPGMLKMVSDIAPVLLYFGLPCAFSDRSRLVAALRIIAGDIGIEGDPRDELRRLKTFRDLQYRRVVESLREAMAKGFASD